MNKLFLDLARGIFTAAIVFFVFFFFIAASFVSAQKLPTAEKVINDYLKAAGGKKRSAAIKDSVYEWKFKTKSSDGAETVGRARTRVQAPAAWRVDLQENSESLNEGLAVTIATNGSSVWRRDENGKLQTLTDAQANAIRLQAQLAATRFTDFKNQRITARVGVENVENIPAYRVEFATRNGAKLFYYFGVNDKLLLKFENPALETSSCFGDYKSINNVLEPHRVVEPCAGASTISRVFELERANYNNSLKLIAFDPPRLLENFDVAAFMKELRQNQAEIDRKMGEYTYRETRTEREFDDKGAVKKETILVYEVFPIYGRRVSKLISENGVPLSPERAEKEANRAAEEIQDIEREREKAVEKRAKVVAQKKDESSEEAKEAQTGISSFLRASEVIAPRREEFRGREAIVLDFRPREGYKAQNRSETFISKLVGTAWIDPQDKRIIRMEMRFPEGFKAFGGLAKLRSGSAFVFEQTRIEDGVWLPKFSQVNASVKAFFVAGFSFNQTSEYSDYRRASTEVKKYEIESPKTEKSSEKP
ncbi:MAG TPA: hypothetical protein VF596_21520 [Pyrinomonadaceae bacterium]|jgi:hypothetical protein